MPATAGRVVLLGIPYDASSSFQRGAAGAPAIIRQALRSDASNLWTEDGVDLGAEGVLGDAGDVEAGEEAEEAGRRIEEGVARLLDAGARPLVLGGDHSVTYPILRAVRRHYPRLSVLHFDAHPDLYHDFGGDRLSHASPFARVMEEGLADRLVQVGIRTLNGHQRAQAERFGVEIVEMRDWSAGWRPELDGPVYVSLDLDVLDPAFAPGVSHREPGGASTRQLLHAIQSIRAPLVGADLVELNPRNDPVGITAPVCAKLVKELAGRMIG